MANEIDITEIMRDKALGRKNVLNDYWGDCWCKDAADEIDRLRAEVADLNNHIDDIYREQAGADA